METKALLGLAHPGSQQGGTACGLPRYDRRLPACLCYLSIGILLLKTATG